MAESYSKLSSSIVYSTIWQESLHVKVVWVTMLAISDAAGYVGASIPGLAMVAGVTVEQCAEAISKFKSPDTFSRNPANEGRRIDDAAGGWILLNYTDYRDQQQQNHRRAQNREAQRRRRATLRAEKVADIADGQHDAVDSQQMSAQAEAEAEAVFLLSSKAESEKLSTRNVDKSDQAGKTFSNCARLIVALNNGMIANSEIGEALNPIAPTHAASMAAAEEILKLVPFDVALEAVQQMGQSYKPVGRSRQITSLLYCRDRVIERWEKTQARAAAEGPAPTGPAAEFERVRRALHNTSGGWKFWMATCYQDEPPAVRAGIAALKVIGGIEALATSNDFNRSQLRAKFITGYTSVEQTVNF